MIVLPVSKQDVRAMHGSAAALPVLVILADEPAMGFSLEFLAAATGYDSRPALIKACRLLQFLRLIDFDEPRANALRNIRLTAAVQLPLPATHTLPAGPASTLTGERPAEDGADGHKAREKFSRENFSSVVVVGVNQIDRDFVTQQHQHTERNSHERWRVLGALRAIGVWPNVADGLAEAGLADVLGWIAYCADPANKIGNRAALIARNLQAGRPAAGAYRPFQICQTCRRIETVCECETPDLYWPPEYEQLAIQPPAPGWGETAEDWLRRRWHCPECFGHPCQCPAEEE